MSAIKRILLNIFRKPFKSSLLLLLIIALGTFSGTSYLISETIKNVESNMKKNIESFAVIRYKNYDDYIYGLSNLEYKDSQFQLYNIYDELSSNNSVIKNNINFATESNHLATIKSNLSHPGKNSFDEYLNNTINLLGIDEDTTVFNDLYTITEGKNVFDNRKLEAIIEENYTYDNGSEIKLGDKIKIEYRNYEIDSKDGNLIYNTKNSIIYELTVIGKYAITNTNKKMYDVMYSQTKPLIISNSFLAKISNDSEISDLNKNLEHDYSNFIYTNILFELDSVDSIEDFQTQYMALSKNLPYFEMLTTADGYLEIKSILDNLNVVSKTIMMISFISSLFIGMLSIYLYIKDRKFEIGMLYALGEKKKNILVQLLCEISLIFLFGLSISIGTSNIIGNMISENIINNQIKLVEMNEIEKAEIKHEFEIQISEEYVIIMYLSGSFIICISCILPIQNLLKSKPKDILM